MFAKINHVAIVSERYALLAAFYQSLFGMSTSEKTRTNRAITVGDGYVGLNINPRRAGRSAGLWASACHRRGCVGSGEAR